MYDVKFSRHFISRNDIGGIKIIFDGDVYNGEQLSFPIYSFMLFRADGRSTANCVLEHDHFGGGSVMVWAGIHPDCRTTLVMERSMTRSTAASWCSTV